MSSIITVTNFYSAVLIPLLPLSCRADRSLVTLLSIQGAATSHLPEADEFMKSQNNFLLRLSFSFMSSKRCFSFQISSPRSQVLLYNFPSNFFLRKQSALTRFSTWRLIHLKACFFLLLYGINYLFPSVYLLTNIVFFAISLFSPIFLLWTENTFLSHLSLLLFFSQKQSHTSWSTSHYNWNRYISCCFLSLDVLVHVLMFLVLRCSSNLG